MQNEILKPVLDTDEVAVPRYDIVSPSGAVIQQNVELRLKNEVVQEGTPYDEESVLPASLREQLALPQSATPAEAMAALLTKGGGAVRRNRPPTTADAEQVGKLWVIPEMFFHNLMPNAVTQVTGSWVSSTATITVSGNAATAVGNATEATTQIEATMNDSIAVGDKVFVQAKLVVNHDANSAVVELVIGDTVLKSASLNVPAAGASVVLQAVVPSEVAGTPVLRAYATYNTAAVQSGKGFTVSDITAWNMTDDMCEAQEDNEFTQSEAANYITTFGQFQTREYEYSTWWWVLRGNTDGAYLWARMYDEATSAVATDGTSHEAWMSPARVSEYVSGRIATQAQAQAGADNTKLMTPLRVKNLYDANAGTDAEVKAGTNTTHWTNPKQVANAAKTVLDTATSKLVSIETVPRVCSVVTTTGGSYLTNFYGNSSTVSSHFYMYAWKNKLYMLGMYYDGSTYYPSIVEYSSSGAYSTQWKGGPAHSSDHYTYNYLSGRCVSSDGSAIRVVLRNYYGLIDLTKRSIIYWSTSSGGVGCGVTNNYQFYFCLSSYSDRKLYYATRGASTSSWTSFSIGSGTSSNYYTVIPIGVYGDTVWFVEQVSASSWELSKVVLSSSPTLTSGVATFESSSISSTRMYLSLLYQNSTTAVLSVQNTISSTYRMAYALKVDLATGNTNWSTVLAGGRYSMSETAFSYVRDTYYMGSTSTTAFFHGENYGYVALNKSTMALSTAGWPLGRTPDFISFEEPGYERVCTGQYEGCICQGTHLWDAETFQDYGIQGTSSLERKTSYVSGIIEVFSGAYYGGNVCFAGTLSDAGPLGYTGQYSPTSTGILLGPPMRTVLSISEEV